MAVPDKYGLDIDELARKIIAANVNGNKILGVIVVRRMGLRFKFQQAFIEYSANKKANGVHNLEFITEKITS